VDSLSIAPLGLWRPSSIGRAAIGRRS